MKRLDGVNLFRVYDANWVSRAQFGHRRFDILTHALAFSCLLSLLPGEAIPDDTLPNIKFHGQVRPRFEVRDVTDGTGADTFTSMRVRAGIIARPEKDVKVFVQFQDVRLWGEETSTLSDFRADNLDLHQGYFQLSNIGGVPLSIRAGRQVLAFSGQRLIGAVEWTQQGRAFDGLRLTHERKGGSLDLFATKLREDSAQGSPRNSYLSGAYGRLTGRNQTLDLYAVYDRLGGAAGTDRLTTGLYWKGNLERLDYRFEFAHQAGDQSGDDINANLAAATVGLSIGGEVTGRIALWYDYLSGDNDAGDGTSRGFNTLFATNHKFYGFADYFLNIPVHTKNRGLQDAAVKVSVKPEKRVSLGLDLHGFWTAAGKGLPSNRLGQEADLTLKFAYRNGVNIVAGYSHFFVEEAMIFLRGLKDDGNFAYLMTDVKF